MGTDICMPELKSKSETAMWFAFDEDDLEGMRGLLVEVVFFLILRGLAGRGCH